MIVGTGLGSGGKNKVRIAVMSDLPHLSAQTAGWLEPRPREEWCSGIRPGY